MPKKEVDDALAATPAKAGPKPKGHTPAGPPALLRSRRASPEEIEEHFRSIPDSAMVYVKAPEASGHVGWRNSFDPDAVNGHPQLQLHIPTGKSYFEFVRNCARATWR